MHSRNSPGEQWLQEKGYVNSACLKWLLILCSCEISKDSFNNFDAQSLDLMWSTGKIINKFSPPSAHSSVMPAFISSISLPRFSLLPSILGFSSLFFPFSSCCPCVRMCEVVYCCLYEDQCLYREVKMKKYYSG